MWGHLKRAHSEPRTGSGWHPAVCGFAVLLALSVTACGMPGTIGTPTPAAQNGGVTAYTPAGAVRASDGSIKWTADLGSAPPAFGDGILYTSTISHFWPLVSAVRASDGKVLWSLQEHATVGPLSVNGHRLLVPLYQNGTLTLTALDSSSGAVVWRTAPVTIEQPVMLDFTLPMMSNLVFAAGNVLALASATQTSSYAFAWNMASGKLEWRAPLPDAGRDGGALGALTLTGDTVILSYPESPATQPLVVTGMDPATGAIRWSHERTAQAVEEVTAQVVVLADLKTVTAVRPIDGAMLWQWQAPPSSWGPYDLLAVTDTTLFYQTFDDYSPGPGDVTKSAKPHLWAVSVATGALIWQRILATDNPEMAWMALAAGGMVLYQHLMPDQPKDKQWPLLALDGSTGATKWQQTAAFPYSQATVLASLVLVTSGSLESTCGIDVWAFDSATGSRVWRSTLPIVPNRCVGFAFRQGFWIVVR